MIVVSKKTKKEEEEAQKKRIILCVAYIVTPSDCCIVRAAYSGTPPWPCVGAGFGLDATEVADSLFDSERRCLAVFAEAVVAHAIIEKCAFI